MWMCLSISSTLPGRHMDKSSEQRTHLSLCNERIFVPLKLPGVNFPLLDPYWQVIGHEDDSAACRYRSTGCIVTVRGTSITVQSVLACSHLVQRISISSLKHSFGTKVKAELAIMPRRKYAVSDTQSIRLCTSSVRVLALLYVCVYSTYRPARPLLSIELCDLRKPCSEKDNGPPADSAPPPAKPSAARAARFR